MTDTELAKIEARLKCPFLDLGRIPMPDLTDAELADMERLPAVVRELEKLRVLPTQMPQALTAVERLCAELHRLRVYIATLQAENARLREVGGRAEYILRFHALRCPLNPMTNHSGMEEHLAMYRAVLKELAGLNLPNPSARDTLEGKS